MNHINMKAIFSTAMSCAALVLVSLGWSQNAKAERDPCPEVIVKSVGKFFKLEHFAYPEFDYSLRTGNGGLIVAGVCKPMPDHPSRIIAAFAYGEEAKPEEYEVSEKKLLLVVYDNDRKQVISSYSGTIGEDAVTKVSSSSIKIDTAHYILAENTRAFGLRLDIYTGRSCGDGYWGDELTLYVMEGKKLRPVFHETMMRGALGNDGSDKSDNRCGYNFSIEANKIISVEKTATNGFLDLRLTAKINEATYNDDEIISLAKSKPLGTIVKYNGKHYVNTPDLDDRVNKEIHKLIQEAKEARKRKNTAANP